LITFTEIISLLQRVRIARTSGCPYVCPSVRRVPVFCPDEWRYDHAVFSIR